MEFFRQENRRNRRDISSLATVLQTEETNSRNATIDSPVSPVLLSKKNKDDA